MYNHSLIEKKWQSYWKEHQTFSFKDDVNKPKFYVLDMFPYPSGSGLHVGHPKGYTATDIISRYKRLKGFNVLHPIGWDAFGLPAEQYAIKTNNHPNEFTLKNIDNFRQQLIKLGFDYDYQKEVNTSDPNYYKWTQWIFCKLFEKGLAEIRDVDVNWCEELKTTLSNEEVKLDSKGNQVSEVGGFPVVKKPMRQWVLKITAYADKLLEGLNEVDWPESLKSLQINWIGKMQGHEISFNVADSTSKIDVFTTRIDTIYGVSYLGLSLKHPFVSNHCMQNKDVESFVKKYEKKSARSNLIENIKEGVFSGFYAINPINQKKVPIWITNYVLDNVGTGAIMGVPAHDERDFEFAQKYQLPIVSVVDGFNNQQAYISDGKHINSDLINGLNINDGKIKICSALKSLNVKCDAKTTYKLKDWVFSRQRYWGEPFPILFDEKNNIHLIDESELPVLLPHTNDFKPSDDGFSPLQKISSFMQVKKQQKKYQRDSNTMPQWAGSCWYYLAYILKKTNSNDYIALNSSNAFKLFQRWLPVDIYIGGQEHAVLHLLYARFWHRFLYDIKVVPTKEPFYKIINQGMILGENGEKMSKSKGNVINPDDIIKDYGADALRLYEMFMGPIGATLPWTDEGINGCRKWLDRVYRYFEQSQYQVVKKVDDETTVAYHSFVKNVTDCIEQQHFNLAISQMMIFLNYLYKHKDITIQMLESFIIVLSCFAPHLSEEIWNKYLKKHDSVCLQSFPVYDEKFLVKKVIKMPFQINGKLKHVVDMDIDLDEQQVIKTIESDSKIKNLIKGKQINKKIVIKNKIVNYIIDLKE